MYASEGILNSIYGQAANETAARMSTQDLLAALSVYLVIAAVTTPIAGCVIAWIAKNEGRQDVFRALFGRSVRASMPPQPEYLLSVPLIIAVVLCLGYMSLELILLG